MHTLLASHNQCLHSWFTGFLRRIKLKPQTPAGKFMQIKTFSSIRTLLKVTFNYLLCSLSSAVTKGEDFGNFPPMYFGSGSRLKQLTSKQSVKVRYIQKGSRQPITGRAHLFSSRQENKYEGRGGLLCLLARRTEMIT